MKKVISWLLCLCLVLSVMQPFAVNAVEEVLSSDDLQLELLDKNAVSADRVQVRDELAIETVEIPAEQMVKVLIIMDEESVLDRNPYATMNQAYASLRAELEQQQLQVLGRIENEVMGGTELDVAYQYTWLLNGMAVEMPYGMIEQVEAIKGVKRVVLQPTYELMDTEISQPNTTVGGAMIGREDTWADGYTGQGIKIAIVDTGLDYDHPNFAALPEEKLTDSSADMEDVGAALAGLNATARFPGLTAEQVYYNTKVVFGFNYCDDDLDITHDNDDQGDHGTHVAGIAAANKIDSIGVVGVAPDAQLYIMKVFGKNGGAYAEDILAALEDALLLGVDVVNMSLGSPSGFSYEGVEYIDGLYESIIRTGTVVSVSAGNSYNAGVTNAWGLHLSLTTNPDNAVVGSPSTYANVLSVASVENLGTLDFCIKAGDFQMGYSNGNNGMNPPLTSLTGSYDLVCIPNLGEPADYEGLDVTGKVALVQRGVTSFVEKCEAAAAAGAVACIIYNNVNELFGMDLTGCTATIPCASISLANGEYLKNAKAENPDLKVSFPTEPDFIANDLAWTMSDFSSWGPAPDLKLKPEITAPGGSIYSTVNGGYGMMSGTSMAAPNVAGLAALVMQYVRETFDVADTEYRTLVRQLLVSTSVPLSYDAETYYSPRQQGSGLANAFNAVNTQAYLTVDNCDIPKAELGDDPDKTGVYTYSFNVHNFGDKTLYYALSTVAQTEGLTADAYGNLFMSGTPMALEAQTAETSAQLVPMYDADNNGVVDSHDVYMAMMAISETDTAAWADLAFRFDYNADGIVDETDVQNALDALVGNEGADLQKQVLAVAPGETATVEVTVTLSDYDKLVLDYYYPNGGYVDGFTFLDALNSESVDLSIPYLAFFGDWGTPPVLDTGYYWDMYDDDATGLPTYSQYPHCLWTNVYGMASQYMPGLNPYFSEPGFNEDYISVSPNDDGYLDTIDDIYVSLLRNACEMTIRYIDEETGEAYYELGWLGVRKSSWNPGYNQILPYIDSLYNSDPYTWQKPDGSALENGQTLLLEIGVKGVDDNAEYEYWTTPIHIDLEAPEVVGVKKITDLMTGKTELEVVYRDRVAVAGLMLIDASGSETLTSVRPPEVEMAEDGYRYYTSRLDVTGLTGKVILTLGDFALNEGYYGLNIAGEGTPYGDFVAFQNNFVNGNNGWVSFSEGVDFDETQVFHSATQFVCAEYVGGFVFAQTDKGALYGFKYEDMLRNTMDLESCYIAQLNNVYQDLAYNYKTGQLLGLYTYVDGEYPYTEINSINLRGEYYDPDMWMTFMPYQEDWVTNRGGLYGLTMACDDEGNVYILGTNYDRETEAMTENAHLWVLPCEYDEWSDSYMLGWQMTDRGDVGMSMNYLQSMTWNHNNEKLYWARFDAGASYMNTDLVVLDVETLETEVVGQLSGETYALFAPMTEETAAKEEHQNLPPMDPEVVATPILREGLVDMNVDGIYQMSYDLDPWYSNYKDVIWVSSDPEIVSVDENGLLTALKEGTVTVKAVNAADETKYTEATINVTALSLNIQGIVSVQGHGVGNVGNTTLYDFTMVKGTPTMTFGNPLTAPSELNFGMQMATSVMGRGSIWTCEFGNTGMIYEIDAETGVVKNALEPLDGDMLFGMTYNEEQDTFAAIMNMYLYVDLPMNEECYEEIYASYDPDRGEMMWHKLDFLPLLLANEYGFVTGETGQGASSEVVFAGITNIAGGERYMMGNYAGEGWNESNYIATQTLVILDNVGRLWYVDEVKGLDYTPAMSQWEPGMYTNETSMIADLDGVLSLSYVDEMGNEKYNAYVLREIVETPMTDMFRAGTLPRMTYHFSDIEYAGKSPDGGDMFAISLYDYWNDGVTNHLYLYIQGVPTGEITYDENWNVIDVKTPDRLYSLGDTGLHYIVASIHSVEVTGGVSAQLPAEPVNTLGVCSFNKN